MNSDYLRFTNNGAYSFDASGMKFDLGKGTLFVSGDPLKEKLDPPKDDSPDSLIRWCRKSFFRFSSALCYPDKLILCTDEMASYPIFFCFSTSDDVIFSSKARNLLPLLPAPKTFLPMRGERPVPPMGKTVFRYIYSVPPGSILTFVRTKKGWCKESCKKFFSLSKKPSLIDMAKARQLVEDALMLSVQSSVNGLNEAAVTLSGGVDSSFIAALASRYAPKVFSYTVGTPYCNEFAPARETANFISSIHEEIMMTEADLIDLLPELIREMEIWDPLTLQIAAPSAFLYKKLSVKPRVFLTGYGADLLFAGVLDVTAPEKWLENKICEQLIFTHPTNELSPSLAERYKVKVRYPYFSRHMLEAGLDIKASLKVYSKIEKYVLRSAAEKYLPKKIAWRPKVGVHEGTAMHRMFTNILGKSVLSEQAQKLQQLAEEVLLSKSVQTVPSCG